MEKKFKRVIWWIKRDFRVDDNLALTAALEQSQEILPVFSLEPEILGAPETSAFHISALSQGACSLRRELRGLGSDIYLSSGRIEEILSQFNFDAVFSHEETGLETTYARDRRLLRWLELRGIPWFELPHNGVIRGLRNRDQRQQIWQRRMAKPPLVAPKYIPSPKEFLELAFKTSLPNCGQPPSMQDVSRSSAIQTLEQFLQFRSKYYSGGISSPNTAFQAGSRLSPHLAWGTISLREVLQRLQERQRELRNVESDEAKRFRTSLRAFSSRLHWHDHFVQRLESEPQMEFRALHQSYENLPYRINKTYLEAWSSGHTGVPMVDACMRCLNECGFLNFRMRAMLVSYACHALHLSWKDILHPLAQKFSDFEPGIHVSQVQMQAGVVGINTVRVYSPDKQMRDHDPQLSFVRRWIPELRNASDSQIFTHSECPLSFYERPIVNFKASTETMKRAIYGLKKRKDVKERAEGVLKKHGSRKQSAKRPRAAQLQLFSK